MFPAWQTARGAVDVRIFLICVYAYLFRPNARGKLGGTLVGCSPGMSLGYKIA